MATKVSATTRVYEAVKRDLLDGVVKPGERIQDAQLRESLSVSRTPVREALLALEQEGLVRIVPRQGYFAAEITLGDVVNAYQLRFILEPIVAAMAATRATDEDIERLRARAEAPTDASAEGLARAIEVNKQFHLEITRLAGNDRLTRIMGELLDALGRLALLDLRYRRTPESWRDEHLTIIDAIASHDPVRTASVIRETFKPDEGLLLRRTRADVTRLLRDVHRAIEASEEQE